MPDRDVNKADLIGGSAATTIELTKEAAEAGATHSIVICPGMSPKSCL